MFFRCKIENPLFYTFTKDSRFYNGKARKYRQNAHPMRTREQLMGSVSRFSFRKSLQDNVYRLYFIGKLQGQYFGSVRTLFSEFGFFWDEKC